MKKLIIIIVIVLAVLGGGFYALNSHIYNEKQADVITPPNGPDENPPPQGNDFPWMTFTDTEQGLSFEYPQELATKYISAENWPPVVVIAESASACATPAKVTRQVDDRTYCVSMVNEGAAGSVYTDYSYSALLEPENRSATMAFTLRATQCGNYDEAEMTECQNEREAFDVDSLADRMFQTITLN